MSGLRPQRVDATLLGAMHTAPCRHETASPRSDAEVAAALARAVETGRRGQWTAPRRRAYALMLQAGGPVKAYDLLERLGDGRPAKPPTVYRALDFLEEQGLVHRIPSLNAFVACALEEEGLHAAAFLICDCCGATQEFDPGRVASASTAAKANGFQPRAVALEVRGTCGRCG